MIVLIVWPTQGHAPGATHLTEPNPDRASISKKNLKRLEKEAEKNGISTSSINAH